MNVSGGIVGNDFDAHSGSEVNISDGRVGGTFLANEGSVVNISGGTLRGDVFARPGSVVNISGGNVRGDFLAFTSSEVNLFGTEFSIGDTELVDLIEGERMTVSDRSVTLAGVLVDGSAFRFHLNNQRGTSDLFSSTGTLTLTLTLMPGLGPSIDDICSAIAADDANPRFDTNGDGAVSDLDLLFSLEAAESLLGDLDFDGTVSFADFLTLSSNFGNSDAPYSAGDMDCDREVGFSDFLSLSNEFGQSFVADVAIVPEPSYSGFGVVIFGLLAARLVAKSVSDSRR